MAEHGDLAGEIRRIISDLDTLWQGVQDSGFSEDTVDEISREIDEAGSCLDAALHYFPET